MFQNTSKLIFYCFLVVLGLNLIVFYLIVTYIDFGGGSSTQNTIMILGLMQWLWIFTGLILAIKGIVKKEKIDLRYKLSTVGLLVFFLYPIIASLAG